MLTPYFGEVCSFSSPVIAYAETIGTKLNEMGYYLTGCEFCNWP